MKYKLGFLCSSLYLLLTNLAFAALDSPLSTFGGANAGATDEDKVNLAIMYGVNIATIVIIGASIGSVAYAAVTKYISATNDGKSGWGAIGGSILGGLVIIVVVGILAISAQGYMKTQLCSSMASPTGSCAP